MKLPCLIFEDDHLLVVNKPAGLNTHAPGPFAGEGLYEWLRNREPRWENLAIIHRLDKETSGVMLFSKTMLANRSLTEQFTKRSIQKKYVLLTDRPVPQNEFEVQTALVRAGDKYLSRPIAAGAEIAHTRFCVIRHTEDQSKGSGTWVQAEPLTGRTHQIRVHAAEKGFPILGDTRYGGTAAPRVCLHSAELGLCHPVSGEKLIFEAPVDFLEDPVLSLRSGLINPHSTTAFRLIHGASDGWQGYYVDVFDRYLLAQSGAAINRTGQSRLEAMARGVHARTAYQKLLVSNLRCLERESLSAKLLFGPPAPNRFSVLENGVTFELGFGEGYSVGLFLDQRDNRRRLLSRHLAAGFPLFESEQETHATEVLNTFAYTCGFSVCAAKAGARTTSLDLSKKYLEWGKRNFDLNQINSTEHDFIFGDVFDWLRRLCKKGRLFDLILVDPPTFSRSKTFGYFRVEKDYSKLVELALKLLKKRGVLFASSNSASWTPEAFLRAVKDPIQAAKRSVLQEQYYPQPPDFPITRGEQAYLKTVWMRIE